MSPTTPTVDTWRQNDYEISTDPARLQRDAITAALNATYWAAGRPPEVIARSLDHSLCFGLYLGNAQIGLARVVTDRATFAYLCDVYVLEAYRGQGLGKWLIGTVRHHPELQGLRRWSLATRDAHGLYRHFGFTGLAAPENWMEIVTPAGRPPAPHSPGEG